jgi:hypothetical protein
VSAAEAIRAARALGVEVTLDGNDLLLEADSAPPAATLEALSRYKAEIIELLRPNKDGWSAEDWQLFFEERAAVAEFDGGLPRTEAEAQAFGCCIVEWLNRNPTPSAPGRCAWCGQSESHVAVVLPYGTEPGTHVWLHAECWIEWQKTRRSQAEEALSRMGIRNFSDACIVSGGCSRSLKRAPATVGTR